MSVAQSERRALADLLEQLGPGEPTLCEGWTTQDLAAHLVARERSPQAGPGILIPKLAGWADKSMASQIRKHGYAGLVRLVRSGPPRFLRPLDSQINTLEYVVHHEDVRRAQPKWQPRAGDQMAAVHDALWPVIRRSAIVWRRRLREVSLRVESPGREPLNVGSGPQATLAGDPVELALYLTGRKTASRAQLTGDPTAVATIEAAQLGL